VSVLTKIRAVVSPALRLLSWPFRKSPEEEETELREMARTKRPDD
jgi:hypothetical protein